MTPKPETSAEKHIQDATAASEEKGVHAPAGRPARPRSRRWAAAAAMIGILVAGLGLTEATGITNVRGTVIRLFAPDGTLVVEVDDPGVSVTIDGEEMVITGTGAKEIRLRPGQYKVLASKDGKVVRQELVTVTREGRQVVRVSREPVPLTVSKPPPSEPPPQRPADRFQAGSVWKGTRTYRKGMFAPGTVTYELHVQQRDGTKFKGLVFDNGPGRNRAVVEGEIKGETLSWRERADHIPEGEMTMQGTLQGDTIRLTFKGYYGKGRPTNEGEGELKLSAPVQGGFLNPTFRRSLIAGVIRA